MSIRLSLAWNEIQAARNYTLGLLDGLTNDEWFRIPVAGVSHIAWQVGHLAMAEYRLVLDRFRGERPEDQALISTAFLNLFGRTSIPQTDASVYPAWPEIRRVLDVVHAECTAELSAVSDDDLDVAPLKPHPLFTTKLGSLLWCARHEMLHAGQIGLLRRQLGRVPQW